MQSVSVVLRGKIRTVRWPNKHNFEIFLGGKTPQRSGPHGKRTKEELSWPRDGGSQGKCSNFHVWVNF